jgi:hypothetical protein
MLYNKLRNINLGSPLSPRLAYSGSKLPPIVITTSSLANGTVGLSYSQTLAATGGVGALTWSLDSGSLPTGLSLSTAGVISGTCSHSAVFSFVVKATDTVSQTKTASLSITVPAVVIPINALQAIDQGWSSPTALWLCDETSGNLVDEVGGVTLTPNSLVTYNADFDSVTGKKCIVGGSSASPPYGPRAIASNTSTFDVTTGSFTISMLIDCIFSSGTVQALAAKFGIYSGTGWMVRVGNTGGTSLYLQDASGGTSIVGPVMSPALNVKHLLTVHRNASTNKARFYLDAQDTVEQNSVRTGSLSNLTCGLSLLNDKDIYYACASQIGWVLFTLDVADGRTGHDVLWTAINA